MEDIPRPSEIAAKIAARTAQEEITIDRYLAEHRDEYLAKIAKEIKHRLDQCYTLEGCCVSVTLERCSAGFVNKELFTRRLIEMCGKDVLPALSDAGWRVYYSCRNYDDGDVKISFSMYFPSTHE